MRKLLAFLVLSLWFSPLGAQPVQTPEPVAIACAFSSAPPTLVSGTFGYVQCDNQGHLLITGPISPSTLSMNGTIGTISLNPNTVTTFDNFSIGAFDNSAGPADARPTIFQTILAPSTTNNNSWENDNSFLTLTGPGTIQNEINVNHSYFQANNGATSTGMVETYESSALNNGSLHAFINFLGIFTNGTSGTLSNSLFGAKFQLTNNNAATGAISQYAAIDMEPLTGGGSVPSFYYLIRSTDTSASINTLGNVAIGTLTPQNNQFFVIGPDSSSGTFPVFIKSQTQNLFFIDDGGTTHIGGNLVFVTPPTGTPNSFACFTAAGQIISSVIACP